MIRRIRNGKELRAWRTRMTISARQLAKLIGVAERSIHRAEKTGNLGVKITLGMELLLSRLQHGEIDLPSSLEAPSRRGRPPVKKRTLVVNEAPGEYKVQWHGKMATGSDIRTWRRSVGLWQKDLALYRRSLPLRAGARLAAPGDRDRAHRGQPQFRDHRSQG